MNEIVVFTEDDLQVQQIANIFAVNNWTWWGHGGYYVPDAKAVANQLNNLQDQLRDMIHKDGGLKPHSERRLESGRLFTMINNYTGVEEMQFGIMFYLGDE